MRICDICQQVTPRLEILPEEFGQVEVCDPCHQCLLGLLRGCEQEAAALRLGLRQAAIEKWRQERSLPGKDVNPSR